LRVLIGVDVSFRVGARDDEHMVTLDDVAREAGVSRTTASRAINGKATVHPDRIAAVQRAAETLGFRPNPAARSLARGRHDSVALIVPETDIDGMTNSFFSMALHGAIREIAKTEQQLVMLLRANGESDEKFLRYLASSHVDGALVILEAHNTELPRLLAQADLPVVYLGRPAESRESSLSYVDSDNVGGGRLAAETLIAAGRRRIAVITGSISMGVTQDRLEGFSRSLAEHGLDTSLVAHSNFQTAGGAAAMAALLARDPELDGVFVMSDLMAAGALATLKSEGRKTPDDVSIVSFDDTVIATTLVPQLTTIRQPLEELGALMVTALAELIAAPTGEPIRHTLPTTLILRNSV
jgi:DNA-binding LacI/PurR family transcriptional regulator